MTLVCLDYPDPTEGEFSSKVNFSGLLANRALDNYMGWGGGGDYFLPYK